MKTYLCLLSGASALLCAGCVGTPRAMAEAPVPVVVAPPPAEKNSLDELVAPIALYPDVLVALILPASTTSSDIVLAARFLNSSADRSQLDAQPWEDSVKALARYPDVIKWMDENLSWTQQLGEAYLDNPQDVMAAIQRDRARARAAGILTDNQQQQVVLDDGNIRIVPAKQDVIYIPRYDPQIVYVERPVYYSPDPWLTFGIGFGVGSWLAYDCDWRARTIWVDHHRHEHWRHHRHHDWRHPRFPHHADHGPYRPGWQRWRPTPERHVEHRRHFDRHHRRDGQWPHRAIDAPQRQDHRGPDRNWTDQNRDRRDRRWEHRPENRRPQPARAPAVNPPSHAVTPGAAAAPSAPTPALSQRRERGSGPSPQRWDRDENRTGDRRNRGHDGRGWSQRSPGGPRPEAGVPPRVGGPRHEGPRSVSTPGPRVEHVRPPQAQQQVRSAPPQQVRSATPPPVSRPVAAPRVQPAPAVTRSEPAPAVQPARQPAVQHERLPASSDRGDRGSGRSGPRGHGRGQVER